MKLSPALKSVINAAEAHPGPVPAPSNIERVFGKIEEEAAARGLGLWSLLAITTATTMTMNSPDSMTALFRHSSASRPLSEAVAVAEYMREVGLRCMGINGIPRTINMLSTFRDSLPPSIASSLNTLPSRGLRANNIESVNARGRALWTQIHRPLDTKLEHKLARAHPDLPVFMIYNVYGGLFADPEHVAGAALGRIATSLCTIACLRAQQGVGPQLLGHVRGLKKAWEDGSWKSDPRAGEERAVRWLVSDEGCIWVLQKIDELVGALSKGRGSTFAPTRASL